MPGGVTHQLSEWDRAYHFFAYALMCSGKEQIKSFTSYESLAQYIIKKAFSKCNNNKGLNGIPNIVTEEHILFLLKYLQ